MERRRREERKGDDKCTPYQNFDVCPRPAAIWSKKEASESVRRRQEREGKGELGLVRIMLGTIRTSLRSASLSCHRQQIS